MTDLNIGNRLKQWRRSNGVKQDSVAAALGVSQAAVSRWENGLDVPSFSILLKITDLVARGVHDDVAVDRMFISRLNSVEAIFDLDGIRLEATSGGMSQLWPAFQHMTNRVFEPRMIGESRLVIDNPELRRAVLRGEVALVSGVTERHLDLPGDATVRHRWVARIRHYGNRVFSHMVYEPCDPATPLGIEDIFHLDDLIGRR
jgi:transcriptional regulator with XRE-family HTH domain